MIGDTPDILTEILEESVNLAIWHRVLSPSVQMFSHKLLECHGAVGQTMTLSPNNKDGDVQITGLLTGYSHLEGYASFLEEVAWLVAAFACLVDARTIGLRIQVLDQAMCPRFHVDHISLRMVTSFAGLGSQWLKESELDRSHLGSAAAIPKQSDCFQQIDEGDVALLKGEKWIGNEGHGIVHRSPQLPAGQRRLLITLDWIE
jgi:hypothetical protein